MHPSAVLEALVHKQAKPALAAILLQWLDEAQLRETASVVADLVG
jgi:hypothetical protein